MMFIIINHVFYLIVSQQSTLNTLVLYTDLILNFIIHTFSN